MRNYTVFVSPGGGLSFVGGFLAEGAAFIQVDYWCARPRTPAHLFSFLFLFERACVLRQMVDLMRRTYRPQPGPDPDVVTCLASAISHPRTLLSFPSFV